MTSEPPWLDLVSEVPADPVRFARSLGVEPDPWQAELLRWRGSRMLLNCSRQAGKSTACAILALHRALTTPKALILLVSPSDRQSGELFRKVADFLQQTSAAPRLLEDNRRSLELVNGARIVSLPSSEATIRGFSAVSLIIEDEAADVGDDLNTAVRPMLAVSGGQMILMGTPKGRRGHFFDAWQRGHGWEKIAIRGWEVPRIPKVFLERERAEMGERFRQEYGCEFVNLTAGLVYGGYDELRNDVARWTATPEEAKAWTFLLGIDFGVVDSTAFAVLGWREHDEAVTVIECYKVDGMDPRDAAAEARRLEQSYAFQRIVGDTSGLGKGFAEEMRRRWVIPVVAAEKQNKLGYIDLLNGALRRGALRVVRPRCEQLIDEWTRLQWSDGLVRKEAGGAPNHCADAVLYAWRACWAYREQPEPAEPTVDEQLRDEQDRMRRVAERHFKRPGRLWD